jgi:hypothetical protein
MYDFNLTLKWDPEIAAIIAPIVDDVYIEESTLGSVGHRYYAEVVVGVAVDHKLRVSVCDSHALLAGVIDVSL